MMFLSEIGAAMVDSKKKFTYFIQMTQNKSNIKIICTLINLNDLAIIFPIFNIIISNNHVNTIC